MSGRTWNRAWLIVAIVVVGLVAARYARSFGLVGIVVPVLALVVIFLVLRAVGPISIGSSRSSAPRPADPRNVTPEPAALPMATMSPRHSPSPTVIIEPAPEASETLETKLATLDRLRLDGRLTDAEYEAKRAQLIADF